MKAIDLLLLGRGYASEIVFSALVLALVMLLVPLSDAAAVIHAIAAELAALTGGLAAASFGMLGVYFSQTSSEFGKYLSWRGVSTAYLKVFGISAFYHVISAVCFVIMTGFVSNILTAVCIFMLALSLSNVVSMICNMVSIIRLRDEFNRQVRNLENTHDVDDKKR